MLFRKNYYAVILLFMLQDVMNNETANHPETL